MYRYKLYEDNGGFFHLAVLNSDRRCVYYLHDNDAAFVFDTRDALKAGGDPIADGWDGGDADPQGMLDEIITLCDARNGSAWIIEEG